MWSVLVSAVSASTTAGPRSGTSLVAEPPATCRLSRPGAHGRIPGAPVATLAGVSCAVGKAGACALPVGLLASVGIGQLVSVGVQQRADLDRRLVVRRCVLLPVVQQRTDRLVLHSEHKVVGRPRGARGVGNIFRPGCLRRRWCQRQYIRPHLHRSEFDPDNHTLCVYRWYLARGGGADAFASPQQLYCWPGDLKGRNSSDFVRNVHLPVG